MTTAQLILLLSRHTIPAILQMREILQRDPEEEVTDEDWDKLKEINDRPFDYYEGPRPGGQ